VERTPTTAKIFTPQLVDVLDQNDKCLWHVDVSPYHAVTADVIRDALIIDFAEGYIQMYQVSENNEPELRYKKSISGSRKAS